LARLLMRRISVMGSGGTVALLLRIGRVPSVRIVVWHSLVLVIASLWRRIGAVLARRRRLVGGVCRRIGVLLLRVSTLRVRVVAAVALSLGRLAVLRLLVVLAVILARGRGLIVLVVAALAAVVFLAGHDGDAQKR